MAFASDAYVGFPISGSAPSVYIRSVSQVGSASYSVYSHPGGGMTGSVMLAASNPNRVRYTILNSGTLPLALASGRSFDPRTNPPTVSSCYDNIVLGTAILQGNQPVTPSIAFTPEVPCFTGAIHCAWIGSGTLSGSTAILAEFSDPR